MTTVLLLQDKHLRTFPIDASLARSAPSYRVLRVTEPDHAIATLQEQVFDVAVIDLSSDRVGGTSTVAAFRRLAPQMPVVLVVSPEQEPLAIRGLSLGARDYVVNRPGNHGLLPHVIRHAIEIERDEHARRQLLEALRVSTARYSSLFENAAVGMAFATLGGVLTEVNAALCAMLGYTEHELRDVRLTSLCHPEAPDLDWTFLDRLRDGTLAGHEIEHRFRHRDGHVVWCLANFSVVRDARHQPLQLVVELRDISARKRAEQGLRESQEESRLILETANDAFIAVDEEGRIRAWNRRAEILFGWSREEALGLALADTVVPPRLREAHRHAFERFRKDGDLLNRPIETTAVDRDGREFPVELTAWASQLGARTRINAFVRDIRERVEAAARLRESEIRLRAIFEGSSIGIAIGSLQGVVVASNPTLQRILGYTEQELVGRTYDELVHPEDAALRNDERLELMNGAREMYVAERRYRRKDGAPVWLRVTASLVRDAHGRPECVVNVLEDLTERREAEAALREKAMQLVDLVSSAASEASTAEEVLQICLTHLCQRVGWPVGHVYLTAAGATPELVPTEIWHLEDPERFHAFREVTMGLRFRKGQGLPGRVLAMRKPIWLTDLERRPLLKRTEVAEASGVRGGLAAPLLVGDEVIGVLEFFSVGPVAPDPVVEDAMVEIGRQLGRIVERKRVDAMYAHQALHDSLTDLPNRMLFVDRLTQALHRLQRRRGGRLALLFVDLDGFKDVNDTFGHDVGDRVLTSLAERLLHLLRPSDTVARFGGDEFTVLCEDLADDSEATAIAERIIQSCSDPLPLEGLSLAVTPSIGVVIAAGPHERPETLLRNADVAMYRAKERGGGCWQLFDESLRKRVLRRRGLEWSLRRAVEANQLRLHYQPSIALEDGSLAGLEALVRWEHPDRGLLAPKEFIPLAEETGLVVPIGEWVFHEACRQRARWRDRFGEKPVPSLSVNLSSRQLNAELPDRLLATLSRYRIDARDLCLEITESVLLDDEGAIDELHRLRSLGVTLSIDDFGTGYSSLTGLKRLPVSQIKLDRSFIAGLGRDPSDNAIIAGVIHMAHDLGLRVVAEGVENDVQLDSLRELGCDCAQGFYFSTPQAPDEITRLLAAGVAAAA